MKDLVFLKPKLSQLKLPGIMETLPERLQKAMVLMKDV